MSEKLEQIRTDIKKLYNVLEEAKTDFIDNRELFLKSKIFKMGRFIQLYHELMKDLEIELDIDMTEALEDLDPSRNLVEDLKTIKIEWDSFLKSLDNEEGKLSSIEIGEQIDQSFFDSSDFLLKIDKESTYSKTSLIELHESFLDKSREIRKSYIALVMLRHFAWLPWRDHVQDLKKKTNEFSDLNFQIIIVSFGELNGACRWYNEQQINDFDMVTDQERKIYQMFDLRKSYYKVWSVDTLIYYSEQLNFKRLLPKAYQDVEDDPHQMGGNLIFEVDHTSKKNSNFKCIYIYRSKNPPDRPSPNDMVNFVRSRDIHE